MTTRIALLLIGAAFLAATPALAAPCPANEAARAKRADCVKRPPAYEPYDPKGIRTSRSGPGFVDVGGGTEVRVSGKTRFEYQVTR